MCKYSLADEAAEALKLTANDLYNFDVADKVIEEENMSYDEICDNLKCEILATLSELKDMPIEELLEKRYQKYRNIGKL